jgi:hypothetical protein
MMLALALALSFSAQAGSRPVGEPSFYAFFDQVVISEIQIQMDRFSAIAAKHPRGERVKLARDLEHTFNPS